jgi:hypothetical protein
MHCAAVDMILVLPKSTMLHTVYKYQAVVIYCNNNSPLMYTAAHLSLGAASRTLKPEAAKPDNEEIIIREIMMMALLHERQMGVWLDAGINMAPCALMSSLLRWPTACLEAYGRPALQTAAAETCTAPSPPYSGQPPELAELPA